MKTLATALMLVLALFAVACDKKAEEPKSEEPKTEPAEEPKKEEPAAKQEPADKPAEGDKVEVAAAGTKFEPPIKPQQLPEGAWFCDMGTVHYAQMDKGEKCPVCGMALKEYKSADYAGQGDEPAAKDDGHHHEGEGGDDHEHGDDHAH